MTRCTAIVTEGSYHGPCNRLTTDGRIFCNDHRLFGPTVLRDYGHIRLPRVKTDAEVDAEFAAFADAD